MRVSIERSSYQLETKRRWFSSDYQTCWQLAVTITLEPDEYDALAAIADVAFFEACQADPNLIRIARENNDPHSPLLEPPIFTVRDILHGKFYMGYSTQANAINDEERLKQALREIKAGAFSQRDRNTEFEI